MLNTKLGLWGLLCVTMTACTLTSGPVTPTPLSTPTPIITGTPNVTIESPQNGAEVNVEDSVLVSATATDQGGVTSVQLFANDSLVKTVSSESVAGDQTLPVVLDYTPRTTGEVNLEVIAFRGTVASDPATVTINVLAEDDNVQAPVQPAPNGPVINPSDPTCRILTNVGLNYRTGPGTNYDRIGTFQAGAQAPIIGRVGDNSWWQVRANNVTAAWVSAEFTTEYGVCFNIPVITPPPTPTTTPATATPTHTPTPTLTPTPVPDPTDTPQPSNTPRPADLVVSDISGPTELTLSGGTVTATYTVQVSNVGDSPTNRQFENTIVILPGDTVVELGVIGNLNPNESIILNQQVTFDASGQFTLQATADSSDEVAEISNINNMTSLVVTVSPAT